MNTTSRKGLWLAVAAVAAVQTAALAFMVWSRVSLLSHGREIVMKVVPVDPRDLFRGEYVVLGYDGLTPLKPELARGGAGKASLYPGAAIYVTLAPDAEKGWVPVGFEASYPAQVEPGHAVFKGFVVDRFWSTEGLGQPVNVRYGIESYFVPEGEGLKLEALVRERKIEAVIALGSDGTAALKGLLSDGKPISTQPAL
jgi:uncharacterized membrane-anchored protein